MAAFFLLGEDAQLLNDIRTNHFIPVTDWKYACEMYRPDLK